MADFDPRNINEGKDKELDGIIRPQDLQDFTGQDKIVANLKIFVAAAKMRGEALDHVLFHGPPGLGKTTLAHIIANELGVNMKVTSGPILDKPGDLAGLLTSLEEGDVLFIDEIHRLSPVVEEYLYSAMEHVPCAFPSIHSPLSELLQEADFLPRLCVPVSASHAQWNTMTP